MCVCVCVCVCVCARARARCGGGGVSKKVGVLRPVKKHGYIRAGRGLALKVERVQN